MRSLRDKLNMVRKEEMEGQRPEISRGPELIHESNLIPYDLLYGIEKVTVSDLHDCDPLFTGSSFDLSQTLLLDTETTGLSSGAGTVAFEIGVGSFTPEGLLVEQFLIGDYSQEVRILLEIQKRLEGKTTLITFNGKTFDIRFLKRE